jgi:drug/metabolite transporter (DMT)-like permease
MSRCTHPEVTGHCGIVFYDDLSKLVVMKTSLTYGFIMTLCGAFISLALFFSDFHADPDKLKLAQNIGLVTGIIISVGCVLLGMREKRADTPADKPWGYGSALGTGVMIGLFGALFGAVYNYVYFAFIDPNFREVILQAQIAALEARNLSSAQIEKAEPMIRKILHPGDHDRYRCHHGLSLESRRFLDCGRIR